MRPHLRFALTSSSLVQSSCRVKGSSSSLGGEKWSGFEDLRCEMDMVANWMSVLPVPSQDVSAEEASSWDGCFDPLITPFATNSPVVVPLLVSPCRGHMARLVEPST